MNRRSFLSFAFKAVALAVVAPGVALKALEPKPGSTKIRITETWKPVVINHGTVFIDSTPKGITSLEEIYGRGPSQDPLVLEAQRYINAAYRDFVLGPTWERMMLDIATYGTTAVYVSQTGEINSVELHAN